MQLQKPRPSLPTLYVPTLIIIGIILRLIWPLDMEWKGDERGMFYGGLSFWNGLGLVKVGLMNSRAVPNFPLSIWLISLFEFFGRTPPDVVRIFQLLNSSVLVASYFLIVKQFQDKATQKKLLLGLGLFCVAPFPILYSRKIWQQCLVPPFTIVFLWAMFRRQKFWFSALMGLFASLIAQIHQFGLFLYAFFFAYLWLTERKRKVSETRWLGVFFGVAVSLVLVVPWVQEYFRHPFSPPPGNPYWKEVLRLLYILYPFGDVFGVDLPYMLQGNVWWQFLLGPYVFGTGVFLTFIAQFALYFIFPATLFFFFSALRKGRQFLPLERTILKFLATFLIFMTLTGLAGAPHYMILLYPVLFALPVILAGQREWIIHLMIGLQLFLSASFLLFIHQTGGAPHTEYGVTYRAQQLQQ